VTIDLAELQVQVAAPAPGPSADAPLRLRIPEAARLLGVRRSTMYQLVARGEVPVLRLGFSSGWRGEAVAKGGILRYRCIDTARLAV